MGSKIKDIDNDTLKKFKLYAPKVELNKLMHARKLIREQRGLEASEEKLNSKKKSLGSKQVSSSVGRFKLPALNS